jgi:hypothetical protein
MKLFAHWTRASRYAQALPRKAGEVPVVLRVGRKYLGLVADGLLSVEVYALTQTAQDTHANVSGTVTLRHLERLGNANHAVARQPMGGARAFYQEEDESHLVLGQCAACRGINRHEPNCARLLGAK